MSGDRPPTRPRAASGILAAGRWWAGTATRRRAGTACSLAFKAAPGTLALYVALTLATSCLPVAAAWLTKRALDNVVGGADWGAVIGPGAGLAVVGMAAGVAPTVTRYLREQLDREVGALAQERLFSAVDTFVGLGRFENPTFLDRLRLAQQAGAPSVNRAVDGIVGTVRGSLTIVGFLGSLFLLSPVMTALVLASAVPVLIWEIKLSRQRAGMYWRIGPTERREFLYTDLLSSVEAAKEVRLFGIGSLLRNRMLAERRRANAAKRSMDRKEVWVQSGLGTVSALVSGAGLLWAVGAAHAGTLSVGDVTMFIASVAGVQGALVSTANEISGCHQALLLLDHYVAVTGAGPDLPRAVAPRPLPRLRKGIELRDVWFRYDENHPWVLRGVNLHIPHGRALALVGLNGAGKSTLVKLLCRFYDPTRGTVLWDGIDLRHVDVAELRERISAVFQDYMNYDMTAAENIALGDVREFTNGRRTRDAAHQAGIHEKVVTLPHGYDTLLSRMFFTESDREDPENGVVLSGGQWQRLALARAFMRGRRDLMILDEPSSGLDAMAEHEVHTTLQQHRRGQTSVLVSHRLGAVRDADTIAVLSGGRVVERGSHDELVAAGAEYARLFGLQASGYRPSTVAETEPPSSEKAEKR
ncbi:ABC transporter ATP-binding protein [Streptomyces sp. NPDC059788]|uniref:ABC transporter ATP-binding protein n=1 Tax=Streptomyces sp. NPDC059788 TaxID=3346948 RepID=UPI003646498A